MNLSNLLKLSDLELDQSAVMAAQHERAALHVVLEHIAEVNRRKSFSPQFKSIHAYVMGKMKYDDKSAWRRVNATYLMVQLPEIKDSIKNGELDLSKLVTVQNFIRSENEVVNAVAGTAGKKASVLEPSLFGDEVVNKKKLTREEKLDAVRSVIGKNSKEAERILALKSSAPEKLKRPEQVKACGVDTNEVRLYLSDEDLKVVKELKDLLAHKYPNVSLSEIVSIALNEAKLSIEKKKSCENKGVGKNPPRAEQCSRSEDQLIKEIDEQNRNKRTPNVALKRLIYSRAHGQCELCESKSATEYDHRIAWALGGLTTYENLRLLCRNCNQREAIKIFGAYEPASARPQSTAQFREPEVIYQS